MREKISKKIEDAMHSIDGIQKASPAPYFFTRLEARMESEKNVWEKITSFVARPSMAFACICLIIIINAIVIFSSAKNDKQVAQQNTEVPTIDEYTQLSANFYEYEK
jgi:hypothetical protein